MPDLDADDGSNLTTVRGQSIDVQALQAELARLRGENARLRAALAGTPDGATVAKVSNGAQTSTEHSAEQSSLSPRERVELFRRLFRGRTDTFPVRWHSVTSGKSGYAPACANEWVRGVCEKPRIKCADCENRKFIALSDQVIFEHLTGKLTAGVYPLLHDDTCYFVVADFDDAEWREDARAFVAAAADVGVSAALEISRSGEGAHAWIFFASATAARDARRLATAIISMACARRRMLALSSYDRLFPNQDTLPRGGFGNLIALPLQRGPRDQGFSVFVDLEFQPYPDQWRFLASIAPLISVDVETAILKATGGAHPLDVTFASDDDSNEPWKRSPSSSRVAGPLPVVVTITRADRLYFRKDELPQPLLNRLVRLAAFQNPEFYKAQAMRMPVWDKPRVIGCAENFRLHVALPRGCLEPAMDLLKANQIEAQVHDERSSGAAIEVAFTGTLRTDQEAAAAAIVKHDVGILSAPTAFGKTVIAAAVIARRGVSTLVIVHRTELLKQWQTRLAMFLGVDAKSIGAIGAGKFKPTNVIDIAVLQSLSRKEDLDDLLKSYGQVIVDECHHVSAVSFEEVLRQIKARYVMGLTATPVRRDGQQPIIFMQCGPIRHKAERRVGAIGAQTVVQHVLDFPIDAPEGASIQDVFRVACNDSRRTAAICADVVAAVNAGRKILVLTERTEHLSALLAALDTKVPPPFVLHGRMSKKERAHTMAALESLEPHEPRVILATGKLIGEGFDHPSLDTLVLAMPISWKGTLQQYAGRLHREHALKDGVVVHDYVDRCSPVLVRMWEKRRVGYQAMGYSIASALIVEVPDLLTPLL
jgi:superfamily II DNA or RNA helicase